MAEFIIKDGTGKGFSAQVDSDKRLHVNSVSRTQLEQASLLGVAYNLTTEPITLTSANESAVAYIKYTGTEPLVIKESLIILGTTTGGTGNRAARVVVNPTGGTIVSNAVNMPVNVNRDFSSGNALDGDFLKGVEGDTMTGESSDFAKTERTTDTVISFDAAPIVLRKGNSIGIFYTPPTGNTNQDVTIAFTVFVETATVSGDLE